jgi:hypothetical protein
LVTRNFDVSNGQAWEVTGGLHAATPLRATSFGAVHGAYARTRYAE